MKNARVDVTHRFSDNHTPAYPEIAARAQAAIDSLLNGGFRAGIA